MSNPASIEKVYVATHTELELLCCKVYGAGAFSAVMLAFNNFPAGSVLGSPLRRHRALARVD